MQIYFVEAHYAHRRQIPAYWRADHDDGRYYTEFECEAGGRSEFERSAAAFFKRDRPN